MRILNLMFNGETMDWFNKLKDIEDVSAGIYIKARASIITRDHLKCPWYKQGLLACEFDLNELDDCYIQELEEIGYVTKRTIVNKVILILGEEYQWYTDPKKQDNPIRDFVKYYNSLCAENDIPNNSVFEAKTFSMVNNVISKKDWKKILEFTFKNWSWLKKELNVGLPTINVLSSTYYWRRIENQFKSKPSQNHVGNRHVVAEDDQQFEIKAPRIKK